MIYFFLLFLDNVFYLMDMEKWFLFLNVMIMVVEVFEFWGFVLGVVIKDNNKKIWGEIFEEVI